MHSSFVPSQGCRSKLIEHKILEKDPNKRIILLVNKIDLVPKQVALTVSPFPLFDSSGFLFSARNTPRFSSKPPRNPSARTSGATT